MKAWARVFSLGLLLLISAAAASADTANLNLDLPDTSGISAELASYAQLDPAQRQARAARAEYLVNTWLSKFSIKDSEVRRGLYGALAAECFYRLRTRTYDIFKGVAPNILGAAIIDLRAATLQDPTHVKARVTLGMVLVQTGGQRAGINQLEKALVVLGPKAEIDGATADLDADPNDADVLTDYLRGVIYFHLALGYRDFGLWDQFGAAANTGWDLRRSPLLGVLRGLHLAGCGRTTEAISWAVRMPALEFRHQTALSSGAYARASDYANRWIKSQALFIAGDLQGARHVLGDLHGEKRQAMPLSARFWQDAGLVCELLHDPAARGYYNMAALKSFMGFAYPSGNGTLAPMVLGFPSADVPYFLTPDQGFEGGSPFAFIADQMNTIALSPETPAAEKARVRALDICHTMLRRQIQPDLVRAFRARVYLATGRPDLAHPDLEFAQAGFRMRGLVDPGTSILLGQQELLAGRNERSRELFNEALAVIPDNALAWRELGVALGRSQQYELARKAMVKAQELEPGSMEGWFNLGVLAYRHGEFEQALVHFRKAWDLDPGNQQVQKMLQTVASAKRNMPR